MKKSMVKRKRESIIRYDGYQCMYCGSVNTKLQLEHIIPKSRGGSAKKHNLVLSCNECNLRKSNLMPSEIQDEYFKYRILEAQEYAIQREKRIRRDESVLEMKNELRRQGVDIKAEVITYPVRIEPHPNADRLEIAKCAGFQSVVKKGDFQDGDVVAYIPIDSILPHSLIEKMGLPGRLYGKQKNRVRPVKLRGVLSEGLICKTDKPAGVNVADDLGIIRYHELDYSDRFSGRGTIPNYAKYQPGKTILFKIKDIKRRYKQIKEGQQVVITEKIHGRSLCTAMYDKEVLITDKRLSWKELTFIDNEFNKENIKLIIGKQNIPIVESIQETISEPYVYLFGEVYGKGVQDLHYGTTEPEFRAFDIYLGKPKKGRFVDYDELCDLLDGKCNVVPLIYRGPYSRKIKDDLTNGKSMICDGIREGIIIKTDKNEPKRVALKSISEDFLLRGQATDYL